MTGTTHDRPTPSLTARRPPAVLVTAVIALVLAVAAMVVVTSQVRVDHEAVDDARACGSALDGILDRSGWEAWWATDLDEPDPAARAALVRTEGCPSAVNRRIVISGGLALLAATLAGYAWRRGPRTDRGRVDDDALARLGKRTTALGATLTVGGLLALGVLIADGDSTLFLYVDRLVVALVGLVVLIQPLVLVIVGRVISALAARRGDA